MSQQVSHVWNLDGRVLCDAVSVEKAVHERKEDGSVKHPICPECGFIVELLAATARRYITDGGRAAYGPTRSIRKLKAGRWGMRYDFDGVKKQRATWNYIIHEWEGAR